MLSKPVLVFAGALAAAGVLWWTARLVVPWIYYWGGALAAAAVLSYFAFPAGAGSGRASRGGRFLCDSCRYNYGDVCARPERPNAVQCPDYRSTGSAQ